MKPKHAYAGLAIAGTLLPLWQLMPFLREHGFDVPLLFRQLFATPAGAFFGMDVIVSSVVLWVFVYIEGRRSHLRHLWIAGAALMGVVVAKLFLVDLSGVGTVERIVSFIGVGVLMLLIGYLSPVPPREAAS